MKAGFIVAMHSELRALERSGLSTNVALSGIGKVNAARTATEMILTQKPDCIINSGCAGSVAEGVQVGDIVLGAETAYHDVWCGEPQPWGKIEGLPQRFAADPRLLSIAQGIGTSAKIHSGLLCTGDQFFVSLREDARILRLYPDALACDMESASIAQVCQHYGVPFLSFRVISDVHTSSEEQRQSYADFWSELGGRSFEVLKALAELLSNARNS